MENQVIAPCAKQVDMEPEKQAEHANLPDSVASTTSAPSTDNVKGTDEGNLEEENKEELSSSKVVQDVMPKNEAPHIPGYLRATESAASRVRATNKLYDIENKMEERRAAALARLEERRAAALARLEERRAAALARREARKIKSAEAKAAKVMRQAATQARLAAEEPALVERPIELTGSPLAEPDSALLERSARALDHHVKGKHSRDEVKKANHRVAQVTRKTTRRKRWSAKGRGQRIPRNLNVIADENTMANEMKAEPKNPGKVVGDEESGKNTETTTIQI
ncbi:Hypothetical Protein FCC1311_026012 [Hondaea fermentalgiana]|uniref:Uncharacterized protein n=1 Tax=Hondaea fermentalgiana TaxID=2315210 RepID=A0A2R5G5W1_9STRA|nr:Hypothetical Protein FCC1311_026012 [Hondaea fermentalgiana]|eukprot:GBG26380.1 Hypothetical Protein FCC1311_026012 [Hondaea fermentalgiana]